jgi:hypothetical protein
MSERETGQGRIVATKGRSGDGLTAPQRELLCAMAQGLAVELTAGPDAAAMRMDVGRKCTRVAHSLALQGLITARLESDGRWRYVLSMWGGPLARFVLAKEKAGQP